MIQPSISDQATSSKQILKELICIFGHKIETLVADACFCIFLAKGMPAVLQGYFGRGSMEFVKIDCEQSLQNFLLILLGWMQIFVNHMLH